MMSNSRLNQINNINIIINLYYKLIIHHYQKGLKPEKDQNISCLKHLRIL